MPRRLIQTTTLALLLPPLAAATEPTLEGSDPATGLRYWEWRAEGVQLRLTQRLPDQTRAFFLARGFDAASAERYATACVFQSLFRNDGEEAISFALADWQVVTAEGQHPPLSREHWSTIWQQAGLPKAARIAFEWSQLPSRQHYQPGDYNWGMSSYGLAPGSRFDLIFSWQRNGQRQSGRLNGLVCAPDIHPD
ncbi:hypothetical protein QVG61_09920 [Thiohalobacter sp. IOR34]|uniref:hypothetical protein n=1 Tax=Thiohalobacter sp. IOR34 TaxID=3057176 RepID=UPI0025AF180B|nr:hypothetical protein [Thiohalobacter sp. IOR34]WJW74814.1 hypothetical protein QVG61_09920 [Thiohalobacter sp. IOR34]